MMMLAGSTSIDMMETEAQQNMRECVKRIGARVEAPSTGRLMMESYTASGRWAIDSLVAPIG